MNLMHSYCAGLVRRQDYDYFLQSLFVREPARAALMAIYALNAELAQVRDKTTEELIGQVRLAWWQEAMESIYAGHPPREQPVLQALAEVIAHVPQEKLVGMIERYRARFPESPDIEPIMDELALALLQALSPQSEAGWRKAKSVISEHRQRHGKGKNGWLKIKLLAAG